MAPFRRSPRKTFSRAVRQISSWIKNTEDEEWLIFGMGLIVLAVPIVIMIAYS